MPSLYQISGSWALWIAYSLFMLILLIGGVLAKGKAIGHAFIVWIFVTAFAPVWIELINTMSRAGNDLAAAMDFYDPKVSQGLPLDNPALGVLIFLYNIMWAYILAALIVSFEWIIVAVKFTGMVAYSVSAVGKRSRQIAQMLFAVGIVATLLGRAAAQFNIEIGQIMRDTIPGGNTMVIGGTIFLISHVTAIGWIIMLTIGSYKGIQAIEGRIVALVKGAVVTTIRHTLKVRMDQLRRPQMTPQPVYMVPQKGPNGSPVRDATRRATRSAGRKATGAASKAALAAGHPWLAAGVRAGGGHVFRDK